MAVAACSRDAGIPAAELRISGDTVVKVGHQKDAKGNALAQTNCGGKFSATLAGNGTARIVGGNVEFKSPEGTRVAFVKWDSSNVQTIWPEPHVMTDDKITSNEVGLGSSTPTLRLTATVKFDYRVNQDKTVRTTTPFIFRCE
jgi:hypothetical protein